jgi:hypothetical protein
MKKLLLAPALAALVASSATAGMTITWTETAHALTGTVSGSFTAAELAYAGRPGEGSQGLHRIDATATISASDPYSTYDFSIPVASDSASINPWNSYEDSNPNNSGMGGTFGFNYRPDIFGTRIYLPSGYVAGTELTGSLIIGYPDGDLLKEQPLSATTFGDIITLAGAPLVTYVNGNNLTAVPEVTSTFTTLGLITSGLLLRRRTKHLR